MSTWSGIRNKLENDYLCPALRGHIQYFATSYSKSADHEGRAAIRMDGVEVLRLDSDTNGIVYLHGRCGSAPEQLLHLF